MFEVAEAALEFEAKLLSMSKARRHAGNRSPKLVDRERSAFRALRWRRRSRQCTSFTVAGGSQASCPDKSISPAGRKR